MAFSLNIYGEDDEVVKRYETEHIRWRLFTEACELQEKIDGENVATQIAAISGFIRSVFPGLTAEELEQADAFDIFATFKQIVKQAQGIGGFDASKNA